MTLRAGIDLKITIVDKYGHYITQLNIVVPEKAELFGKTDILTFYFGEANKVVDCSK